MRGEDEASLMAGDAVVHSGKRGNRPDPVVAHLGIRNALLDVRAPERLAPRPGASHSPFDPSCSAQSTGPRF